MVGVALMAGSLIVVVVLVAVVPGAIARRRSEGDLSASGCPKPPRLEESFEGGGQGGLESNAVHGALTPVTAPPAYDSTHAMMARYPGGGDIGYARVQAPVSWVDGDDVWYGAAYYLPPGFLRSVRDTVDLMRWDNFASHPRDTDHSGLTIWKDGRLRLIKEEHGRRPYTVLIEGDRLPEGRWVWLEVHQRFSARNGHALNEVYVDAVRVGRSRSANYYGRQVQMLRYGIVAVGTPAQTSPLSLYLDRIVIGPCEVGPRGWAIGQG